MCTSWCLVFCFGGVFWFVCLFLNLIMFLCYISRFLSVTSQLNDEITKACAWFHAHPSPPMILASLVLGRTKAAVEAVGSVLQSSDPVHGLAQPRVHIFWFGVSPAGPGPLYESREHHHQHIQHCPTMVLLGWTESQVNSTTVASLSSQGKTNPFF